MHTDLVWLAVSAATIPCVILDLGVRAVQARQRRQAGIPAEAVQGTFVGFLVVLVWNAALVTGFVFLYATLWAGSGRAFVYGGTLWLFVAIPLVLMSKYMDEIQKKVIATRILGWLFKLGAASTAVAYFIG